MNLFEKFGSKVLEWWERVLGKFGEEKFTNTLLGFVSFVLIVVLVLAIIRLVIYVVCKYF